MDFTEFLQPGDLDHYIHYSLRGVTCDPALGKGFKLTLNKRTNTMEHQQQNGMVQWNGTGWKALFDEACSAGKALQALKTAMANMTVHGRDFEDSDSLRTALAEHRVVMATLAQAERYLQQRIDHTLKGHMDHLPKPMSLGDPKP